MPDTRAVSRLRAPDGQPPERTIEKSAAKTVLCSWRCSVCGLLHEERRSCHLHTARAGRGPALGGTGCRNF
eukprot:1199306-Prymnesium_polylepis.1